MNGRTKKIIWGTIIILGSLAIGFLLLDTTLVNFTHIGHPPYRPPFCIYMTAVLPLFFWIRGIMLGSRSYLIAGFVLLVSVSCSILFATGTSRAFSDIGGLVALAGIGTLVGGSFARPDCFLKRNDRKWLGILLIVVGLLTGAII